MLSVIIPHLNQPEALLRCLGSLTEQKGAARPVEILVVDNGSIVPPATICERFSNCTLLAETRPGPGPARNRGISAARGDILAFIDADCVATPGWLAAIERAFDSSAEAMILGGDVRILCEDPDKPTLLEAYESIFAFRMREYIEKKGFTGTGNLAVRPDVFEAVGTFGGIEIAEDAEWGQRAGRAGYRIRYVPDMIIYHPARREFSELAQKWDRHVAHDFNKARTKRLWMVRWLVLTATVAVSPLAEIPRIVQSERLEGVRPKVLALIGVVRVRLYRSRVMLALATGSMTANDLSGRWNRV